MKLPVEQLKQFDRYFISEKVRASSKEKPSVSQKVCASSKEKPSVSEKVGASAKEKTIKKLRGEKREK